MTRVPPVKMPPMSERELTDAVIDLASLCGWLCHHDRPARTEQGWRTAIQGHPGFPDLLLVRGVRMVAVECKSAVGMTTAEQDEWLRRMRRITVEVYVWRPADWLDGTIERVLR